MRRARYRYFHTLEGGGPARTRSPRHRSGREIDETLISGPRFARGSPPHSEKGLARDTWIDVPSGHEGGDSSRSCCGSSGGRFTHPAGPAAASPFRTARAL
ncbi:hypothetical protein NSERUTF1_4382 [Nocardia seriolae]|nr:hypothetical protein NSERUTF1_4382 [Nocardia seriolae]